MNIIKFMVVAVIVQVLWLGTVSAQVAAPESTFTNVLLPVKLARQGVPWQVLETIPLKVPIYLRGARSAILYVPYKALVTNTDPTCPTQSVQFRVRKFVPGITVAVETDLPSLSTPVGPCKSLDGKQFKSANVPITNTPLFVKPPKFQFSLGENVVVQVQGFGWSHSRTAKPATVVTLTVSPTWIVPDWFTVGEAPSGEAIEPSLDDSYIPLLPEDVVP